MHKPDTIVLGIETTCDETAVGIVKRQAGSPPQILANVVQSQFDQHEEYGGVVPEIAARAHLNHIRPLLKQALDQAQIAKTEINAVCASAGPGLIGGLIVGLMAAKGMALALNRPFLAINHLEAHALTPRLTNNLQFPYLLLLVSGGHTQILAINGLGQYERLATTIDDAVGEAFDKTAKMLGLGMPGGPRIEQLAKSGDPSRFTFPMPLRGKDTLNMSFSGLKTAVRLEIGKLSPTTQQDKSDICASFQRVALNILRDRCEKSMQLSQVHNAGIRHLVVAGGVGSNLSLRSSMKALCDTHEWQLVAPPLDLCTDNGAMVAWAGLERFERGESHSLNVPPRSRWPLDEKARTILGSGKRGQKV